MSVSLTKGGSLSLAKPDGSTLTKVRLGLGWDMANSGNTEKKGFFAKMKSAVAGGSIDLDASAILFDAAGNQREIVYYGNKRSKNRSVTHSGDNLTGAGDGDDEQIVVELNDIPADIQTVVFTINSYSGQKFDQLENVFARVCDLSDRSESEIVRYNLAESKNNTGLVIAKISREGGGWKFSALGEFADGKTAHDLVALSQRLL